MGEGPHRPVDDERVEVLLQRASTGVEQSKELAGGPDRLAAVLNPCGAVPASCHRHALRRRRHHTERHRRALHRARTEIEGQLFHEFGRALAHGARRAERVG